MENHSRRVAHGDPRPAHHHESSDRRFTGIFCEAVVQHVTYVTALFVGLARVAYRSWGTTPLNFQFSGTGVVAALQPVR